MTGLRLIALLFISISANTYGAGDITAGQEKSQACQGCHGLDGNSFSPEWPNLAGQHQNYLIKQVMDFQSGARVNETMSPMVEGLSKDDITDIAAYFTAQSLQPEAAESSAQGKRLYQGGNAFTRVPACASCHGPNGTGNAPGMIPAVAGQKVAYTAQTLRDFKSGVRTNDRNKIMQDIASRLSENEIDAVAAYTGLLPQNKP